MRKKCFIIDDDDQSEEIEKISALCLRKGISADFTPINPSDKEFFDANRKFNSQLFNEVLIRKIRKATLVACDYGLGTQIDGLKVARTIRANNKLCRIVLYSGKLSQIIKEVIGNDREDGQEIVMTRIKDLVHANISDFIDRTEYSQAVVNQLSTISADQKLASLLETYPNLQFVAGEILFDGMTFGDIAEKIREGTSQSEQILDRLLELLIAYVAKLNNSTP